MRTTSASSWLLSCMALGSLLRPQPSSSDCTLVPLDCTATFCNPSTSLCIDTCTPVIDLQTSPTRHNLLLTVPRKAQVLVLWAPLLAHAAAAGGSRDIGALLAAQRRHRRLLLRRQRVRAPGQALDRACGLQGAGNDSVLRIVQFTGSPKLPEQHVDRQQHCWPSTGRRALASRRGEQS